MEMLVSDFKDNMDKVHEIRNELKQKQEKGYCIVCKKPLRKYQRFYCSSDCSWKIYKMGNWRQHTWDNIRRDIIRRDNYTCQKCFKKRSIFNLEVHHVIPKSFRPDFAEIYWNLITLCINCHTKFTKAMYNDVKYENKLFLISKNIYQKTLMDF